MLVMGNEDSLAAGFPVRQVPLPFFSSLHIPIPFRSVVDQDPEPVDSLSIGPLVMNPDPDPYRYCLTKIQKNLRKNLRF